VCTSAGRWRGSGRWPVMPCAGRGAGGDGTDAGARVGTAAGLPELSVQARERRREDELRRAATDAHDMAALACGELGHATPARS